MRATIFRTAMVGGGLSYDVYVPVKQTPKHVREACPGGMYYTVIDRGEGRRYYEFDVATITPEHEAIPQGLERWESWKAHEKAARAKMLELAQRVFPELANVKEWPILWLNNLGIPETDAMREIEV